LKELLGNTPAAEAFAWRSPRARQMGLDAKSPPPDAELIRLMLQVPYLLKRPVVRMGGRTVFGFDRTKLEALLGEPGRP